MKRPSVNECLDEIRRLKAENERLMRLSESRRPELPALRAVATEIRDLLFNLPMRLEALQASIGALLPENDADLPTLEEMWGCLSDGRERVERALNPVPSAGDGGIAP